jgi:hypothetical protein
MNHKAGIWIDHKKAVIVSVSADCVSAKTLESTSDRTPVIQVAQVPDGRRPAGGRGEKKYEERYGQHLDRYYDEVISRWGRWRLF